MPANDQPTLEEPQGRNDQGAPRRTLVLVVALVCLLTLAGGLFVILRDGDGTGDSDEALTTVTFGPEGDATTILEPPPGSTPVIGLSVDAGLAGSEVTLQGTSFKAGKEFGPIDVFWDRVGGLKLASADGPRFSVKLKIPGDAGVRTEGYNVFTVQSTRTGTLVSQTSVRFFVLAQR